MGIKKLLPWICAAILLLVAFVVYSSSQKQGAELAQVRQEYADYQKQHPAEESKPAEGQEASEELTQLRKEHNDLLRLRGEVTQLRQQVKDLTQQLANARNQAQTAASRLGGPVTGEGGTAPKSFQPTNFAGGAPQTPEQQKIEAAFRARYGLPGQTNTGTPEQIEAATCMNNLRMIAGAKQQWALEHNRPNGGLVGAPEISTYLPGNNVPVCPGGGAYTINPVGINPICSIPSHVLPKQ